MREECGKAIGNEREAVVWPKDTHEVRDRLPEFQIVYLPPTWLDHHPDREKQESGMRQYIEQCGNGPRRFHNGLTLAVPERRMVVAVQNAVRLILTLELLQGQKAQLQLTTQQEAEAADDGECFGVAELGVGLGRVQLEGVAGGEAFAVQASGPREMADDVVLLWPFALEHRFGLAVALLLFPVGANGVAVVVPHHRPGTEAEGPPSFLQSPADIHIVAGFAEDGIETADFIQRPFIEGHVATGDMLGFAIGEHAVGGSTR